MNNIIGHEVLRRAVNIAHEGAHSLKMIYFPGQEYLIDWVKNQGVNVFAFQPCPCGYLGHPKVECICADNQLKKYSRQIANKKTSITVKLEPDSMDKIIDEFKFAELDKDAIRILKLAADKFNYTYMDALNVASVAMTISHMAGTTKVEAVHVAEAIQYGSKA